MSGPAHRADGTGPVDGHEPPASGGPAHGSSAAGTSDTGRPAEPATEPSPGPTTEHGVAAPSTAGTGAGQPATSTGGSAGQPATSTGGPAGQAASSTGGPVAQGATRDDQLGGADHQAWQRPDGGPQPEPTQDDAARYQPAPQAPPQQAPHPGGTGVQPAVGPQSQAAPAGAATAPQYRSNPVAFRRPDVLAGLLLLLAGVAAGVSLVLDWLPDGRTGTDLVRTGVDQVRTSFSDVVDSGFWQPLLVVLGGGALALLGLLMFLPARRHRLLGLLALLVAGGVVAAVLVPLVQERFRMDTFDLGFYVAIAVAVLGLLGALKALLTGPKYATAGPT